MARAVLPRVHALVICDEIEDRWEEDGLYDLQGVRTQLLVPGLPYNCPQLCVYVQATGHQGTSLCRAAVLRGDNDEEIATTAEQEVHFTGPRDFLHLGFWIVDCEFPYAGVYWIQVLFDGKMCSERAIEVIESEGEADGRSS